MARAWRIEFEGALYHVLSRGNEKRDIFFGDDDRRLFLDTLGEMAQRFEIDVFVYVLMDTTTIAATHPSGQLVPSHAVAGGYVYQPLQRQALAQRPFVFSEVEKLAGLNRFEISSGKFKGNRHISKRGRPLLRKLLFFAAINTVRKGGVMDASYQRYLERGMPKIKALVAISRRLLRILSAFVRDHSKYQKNYSQEKGLKLAA